MTDRQEHPVLTVVRRYRDALLQLNDLQEQQLVQRWMQAENKLDPYIAALAYWIENETLRDEQPTGYAIVGSQRYYDLMAAIARVLGQYHTDALNIMMRRRASFAAFGLDVAIGILAAQGVASRLQTLPDAGEIPPQWQEYVYQAIQDAKAAASREAENKGLTMATLGAMAYIAAVKESLAVGLNSILGTALNYGLEGYRGAMEIQYGASLPEITAWQRFSAHAPTTCMACILLEGTIYSNMSDFADHPHGLCFLVGLAGIDSIFETEHPGLDWFLGLTDAEQQSIMGPRYWDAWHAGLFDIWDLILMVAEGYAIVEALKVLLGEDEEEDEGDGGEG